MSRGLCLITMVPSGRCAGLGRKNHYRSKAKRGTKVACLPVALFYSLFESAKLAGMEPAAMPRAIANPGTVLPALPHDLVAVH